MRWARFDEPIAAVVQTDADGSRMLFKYCKSLCNVSAVHLDHGGLSESRSSGFPTLKPGLFGKQDLTLRRIAVSLKN